MSQNVTVNKALINHLHVISQDSPGHSGHAQTAHHGDSALAGQRGSKGCAAAVPSDTSGGSLENIMTHNKQMLHYHFYAFLFLFP